VPFTLLEGCLDEPLLLTNDGTRRHALANVCTHRAMALASAPFEAPFDSTRRAMPLGATRSTSTPDALDTATTTTSSALAQAASSRAAAS
jgi:hypothetical protein